MEYQYIDIIINKKGNVTLEVKGVKGKKCVPLTEDLIEELGELIKQEKTIEFRDDDKDGESHISVDTGK